jgi:glutamate racemase
MHRPIAVFDAGTGSYAIIAEIQKALPRQDIVYLADRASFPYGGKSRSELLSIMQRTIAFLETFDPSVTVIASNAPSIMVLEALRGHTSVPLFGVFPPLHKALDLSLRTHAKIVESAGVLFWCRGIPSENRGL